MELNEIKISKDQFDKINNLRYDLKRKHDYIVRDIIGNQYEITPDTTFITYQDKYNYYLVFEGAKVSVDKIPPSSCLENEKLKEK